MNIIHVPSITLPSDPILALKLCHYFFLGFSSLNLLILYFMQKKGYPLFRYSTFFFNFIIVYIVFHRKFMHELGKMESRMDSHRLGGSQNEVQIKQKTIWTTLSEICQLNINTIFLDITNCFYNSNINDIMESSSTLSDIPDSDTEPSENKRSEKDSPHQDNTSTSTSTSDSVESELSELQLEDWEKRSAAIQEVFTKKYTEFKIVEDKLLKIREDLQVIINWSKNTLEIFDQDENVQKMIQKKLRHKLEHHRCSELLKEYNLLKKQLNHLCKYLHNNLQTNFVSKCPICVSEVKDAFIVPCGHCVCSKCIQTQVKYDKKIICPICRCTGDKMGTLYF